MSVNKEENENEEEINTCPKTMEEFMKQLDKITKRSQEDVESLFSGFERLVKMAAAGAQTALKNAYGRYLTLISSDVVSLEGTLNSVQYIVSASRLLSTALTPLTASLETIISGIDRALCKVSGISALGIRCETSTKTMMERITGAMTIDRASAAYRGLAPALIYAASLAERVENITSELISTETAINTISTDCLPTEQRKAAQDALEGTRERIAQELTAVLLLGPSIKSIARSIMSMAIKTGMLSQDIAQKLTDILSG